MKKIFGPSVMTVLLGVFLNAFLFLAYAPSATAQMRRNQQNAQNETRNEAKPEAKSEAPSEQPKETSSVTDHTIRIGGETIPYKATAGTILLKNDDGEPTGLMFYVAYTRSDAKDMTRRPVAFFYNGGPGSSTIWLHMGAYGPKRVVTSDASATPPAPYKLVDNEDSLLDVTDEVFIDAMGTGFSHAVGKAHNKDFWGVDQDMRAFGQFINNYVTENNRWNSPKFLIGESYGTFRSAVVGNYVQSHYGMDLNGIVLMSSVLDLGTISFYPGEDLAYVLYVPSYAATACYHKILQGCPANLDSIVDQSRQFASTEYADALLKGDKISESDKEAVAKKLAQFTGLSEDYILKANLRVSLPQFMAELQRSRGLTTGRLDSRFSGPADDPLAEYASYDPQSTALSGAYTAAFNDYIRQDLNYGKDMTYLVSANFAGASWDWKHGGGGFGFPGSPNVEPDLVEAMISNPHLHVEVENGIYDLATPFYETEYTMDHLDLPPGLRSHITLKYYDAGHMMYVYDAAHAKLKANVAAFIDNALKQ